MSRKKRNKKRQKENRLKSRLDASVEHKMMAHIIASVISVIAFALGVYYRIVLITEHSHLHQFYLALTSGVKPPLPVFEGFLYCLIISIIISVALLFMAPWTKYWVPFSYSLGTCAILQLVPFCLGYQRQWDTPRNILVTIGVGSLGAITGATVLIVASNVYRHRCQQGISDSV